MRRDAGDWELELTLWHGAHLPPPNIPEHLGGETDDYYRGRSAIQRGGAQRPPTGQRVVHHITRINILPLRYLRAGP